ncbi:MAG TPA: preprotein translocase subunit SecE [Candidatus Saccharimonadales bacterium]|nr:preprotein translocase subunit SecE [Candidatus Saccharimonadales bacterium]
MARQVKPTEKTQDNESLTRVFFRGFFWPVRMLGKGLAWLAHHPPLKQIGHGLRWFFLLKPLRFLGRILGLRYIYSSWQELRLVTWPTQREGRRLTSAVIIFAVVFGALIAVVDYGLDKLFKQLLLK